ncbi:hypothetical protein RCH23_003300 [Cryobacterium sp. CAN_C3]|nr:hypothetical protein [Cryobacterium sp. CAN_C3]
MPRNHAQGTDAWDETGIEYSFQGAFVDSRDAARRLKYGARLGVLQDWGTDNSIQWLTVPVFSGSNALKSLHRWFKDQLQGIENPSFTHWLEVSGSGEIILLWDDCSALRFR